MTEIAEIPTASTGGDSMIIVAYQVITSAGATGTRAASGGTDKSIGYNLAIKAQNPI